jgi:hypothetical protein
MQRTRLKILRGTLALVAALGFAGPASATSTGYGNVDTLQFVGTQYVIVRLTGSPVSSGRPSCHDGEGFPTGYAFDYSTTKGKTLLTALQAALLAAKPVTITGATTCTNTGSFVLETATGMIFHSS